MRKAILRDIHVSIGKPQNYGGKLYDVKPVVTCSFELERTASEIRQRKVQLTEGTWIVDTDNARHSIEHVANIDLETMVRNRLKGLNPSDKTVKEGVKDAFLKWCYLMMDEHNRQQFLSHYKGDVYEVAMRDTTNPFEGNALPQIYRVSGVCKDDSFERAIEESNKGSFTLNKKRK